MMSRKGHLQEPRRHERCAVLAQIAITEESISQGAVLASILAGFAFVGSTSARDRSTVLVFFTAGMFMLVSLWAGLMALVSENLAAQNDLANVFFFALGIGSVLFVLGTVGHIAGLQGRRTAAWCLALALVVIVTAIILGEIARR
jgi:hypothetical protein